MLDWFRRTRTKGVSYFVKQVRKEQDPENREVSDEVARGAFQRTFSGKDGELVLAILGAYSGANVTVIRDCMDRQGRVDPHALSFHQGQADTYRFIESMCAPIPKEVREQLKQEEEETDAEE